MIKYFVSYFFTEGDNKIGFGNTEVESDDPITAIGDIDRLTGFIAENYHKEGTVVSVITWKEFDL